MFFAEVDLASDFAGRVTSCAPHGREAQALAALPVHQLQCVVLGVPHEAPRSHLLRLVVEVEYLASLVKPFRLESSVSGDADSSVCQHVKDYRLSVDKFVSNYFPHLVGHEPVC